MTPTTELTDRVPVNRVPGLLGAWERYSGRPAPSPKTVANWAWRPERSGFPAPVSTAQYPGPDGKISRRAREYRVSEVLVWWLEYSPQRPGRKPRAGRCRVE